MRSRGKVAVEETSPAALPQARLMPTVGVSRPAAASQLDRSVSYAA